VFIVLGYVLGCQADELRRLSMTDALTGLSNRHAFHVRPRDEWRRSRRYRAPLALLLIDPHYFLARLQVNRAARDLAPPLRRERFRAGRTALDPSEPPEGNGICVFGRDARAKHGNPLGRRVADRGRCREAGVESASSFLHGSSTRGLSSSGRGFSRSRS
jgi:hypothetical protein